MRVGGDNCASVDELLVDYAYDELPSPDRKGVEAHLLGCARCRASVDEMAQTRRVMQSLVEEPPPDAGLESLIDYARKGAARRTTASSPASSLRWLFGALPVAGLLVVVLIAVNRSASPALFEASPASTLLGGAKAPDVEGTKSAEPVPRDQRVIAGAVEGTRGGDLLATTETLALSLEKKAMRKSVVEDRRLDRGGGAGVGSLDKAPAPVPAMKPAAWPEPSSVPEARSRRAAPDGLPVDGPSEPFARMGSDSAPEAQELAGPRGNIADSRAATNFVSPIALDRKAKPAEERETPSRQRSQDKGRGTAGEDLYLDMGAGSAAAQPAPVVASRSKAEAQAPAPVSEAAFGAAGGRGSVLSVASAPPEPPAPTLGLLGSAGGDFEGHGSVAKGFVQKDQRPRPASPSVAQAPATRGPARDRDDEADSWKEESKVKSSAAREPAAPAEKKADMAGVKGDPFRAGIDASSRGDRDEAISLLSRAIADQPAHAGASDALFLLARQQWARGDLAGALRSYEQFVARFPTHPSAPQAVLFRAQLLAGLNRDEEADRALDELEKRYPHSPQVREVGRMRARAVPVRAPSSAAPLPAAAH